MRDNRLEDKLGVVGAACDRAYSCAKTNSIIHTFTDRLSEGYAVTRPSEWKAQLVNYSAAGYPTSPFLWRLREDLILLKSLQH
jgi:hypothetical protein